MVNKVTLIGRVGKDPEFRATQSGTSVAKFTVATSRRWLGKDGEWQEETEWHRIVTFGKRAESVNKNISKGRLVYIEGRLHYDSYTDKDGIKKYTTDIFGEYVRGLDKKDSAQSGGFNNDGPNYEKQAANSSFVDDTEDDVPF